MDPPDDPPSNSHPNFHDDPQNSKTIAETTNPNNHSNENIALLKKSQYSLSDEK